MIALRSTALDQMIRSLQEIWKTDRALHEPGIANRHSRMLDEFSETLRNLGSKYAGEMSDPAVRRDLIARHVEKTVSEATNLIDAATLVFAHSVLDAHIFELCRLTAFIAPEDWMGEIEKRQVSLGEIKTGTFESHRDRMLDRYFEDLDGRSLLKKSDSLHERCKPKSISTREPFTFSRDRLKEIDDLRHEIVHGDGLQRLPATIGDGVAFLVGTTRYCTVMVRERYKLTVLDGDLRAVFQRDPP